MNDLISRKDAIEHLKKRLWETALNNEGEAAEVFAEIADDRLDTWMAEIRPAQQWIPVKYRPMTEDEKAYWLDRLWYDGECELSDNMMFDCQMPDDGQKILVCSKCGNIWIDTHEDDGGLMGLEENDDWEGIVAWMPLPEQYKEENNEQVQG